MAPGALPPGMTTTQRAPPNNRANKSKRKSLVQKSKGAGTLPPTIAAAAAAAPGISADPRGASSSDEKQWQDKRRQSYRSRLPLKFRKNSRTNNSISLSPAEARKYSQASVAVPPTSPTFASKRPTSPRILPQATYGRQNSGSLPSSPYGLSSQRSHCTLCVRGHLLCSANSCCYCPESV